MSIAGFLVRLVPGGLMRARTLQAGTGIAITNPDGQAGDPTISATGGTGTVTHTGALTADQLVLGNGAADIKPLGAAGTTTQVLHGNAAGVPSFGAVALASDVSGDLPFANLAQGAALSVLGVTGNAIADVASIAAASDGQVVRRSGTAVAFGAVDLANANAVTGTLPDGNLSANVPLLNAVNVFSSVNSFLGTLTTQALAVTTTALDLIIGNIKFPATQNPSGNANTLDDYEEGTWTPTDASGAGLSFTASGTYVKIGQMVFAGMVVTFPATADGSAVTIGGLPFTVASGADIWAGLFGFTSVGATHTILAIHSSLTVQIITNAGSTVANSVYSSKTFTATMVYRASA